jgi:ParB/RepB/Spo0J family partition protein
MQQNRPSLFVEYLPIDAIEIDPRNPREHSNKQIKQIAKSIKSFGFNVPAIIDRDNKILAGHGRLLAAQSIGMNEIPIIRLYALSEAQARAFSIADNKLCENSSWNEQLLEEIFLELSDLDLNFSLDDTGCWRRRINASTEKLRLFS